MLKFTDLINCIFVHWTMKLTLKEIINFYVSPYFVCWILWKKKLILFYFWGSSYLFWKLPHWRLKIWNFTKYRTRAIISRGLYIFYPISKDHFFVFKEVFSENSVLMYGLYSRAASNQERLMMARVRYSISYVLKLHISSFYHLNFTFTSESRLNSRCTLKVTFANEPGFFYRKLVLNLFLQ